jgi:hypothetical protein
MGEVLTQVGLLRTRRAIDGSKGRGDRKDDRGVSDEGGAAPAPGDGHEMDGYGIARSRISTS